MTQRKVKPGTGVKLKTRGKVKLSAGSRRKFNLTAEQVKLEAPTEDWKMLKTFVGVKFNDQEKQKLWPFVKDRFDLNERFTWKPRVNLSTILKQALWKYISKKRG